VTSAYENETVVASVVLKPASGRQLTGESIITARTLREFAPDPRDAEAVARAFAAEGFDVGPVGGIGMAVSGSRRLFETYFDTAVEEAEDGGWIAVKGPGPPARELPLTALPEQVAQRVHAVTFEPPAEAVMP